MHKKELVKLKMSLNNKEFLIWKERGRDGQVGHKQAGISKVISCLALIEERFREIERHT
jgi:hypothetical protein